jgi:hypothetical protein
MITQKELIQKRADFWKEWFLEQTRIDLDMTTGLLKSMTAKACQERGENDDTGLYHASLLAETRVQDFAGKHLEKLINSVINCLVADIESLNNPEP